MHNLRITGFLTGNDPVIRSSEKQLTMNSMTVFADSMTSILCGSFDS